MKSLIFLVLTNIIFQSCLSQNYPNKDKFNCYQEKIKWNINDKNFKDSTLLFRNYIDGKKDKRVVCETAPADNNLENLIWNCKYLSVYLQYLEQTNKFAFISYQQQDKNNIIVSFFLCSNKSKESCEMRRFKILNNKIVGIIIFPFLEKDFIPIEKYDNTKIDRID